MLNLEPFSYKANVSEDIREKTRQQKATAEEELENLKMKPNMADKIREQMKAQFEEEIAYSEEPADESCYEYKLVGINVHSGSANAGHYWSYINTNRADYAEQNISADDWKESTERDRWMEFNDAQVSDWSIKASKEGRCFGSKQARGQNSG